mmetsp:Transcript_85222/g.244687  ORF Transcript_85222/g.244687 Transcript_85222/m.244687 type:complete len:258 (+) Transcript_85222:578-1351(+)
MEVSGVGALDPAVHRERALVHGVGALVPTQRLTDNLLKEHLGQQGLVPARAGHVRDDHSRSCGRAACPLHFSRRLHPGVHPAAVAFRLAPGGRFRWRGGPRRGGRHHGRGHHAPRGHTEGEGHVVRLPLPAGDQQAHRPAPGERRQAEPTWGVASRVGVGVDGRMVGTFQLQRTRGQSRSRRLGAHAFGRPRGQRQHRAVLGRTGRFGECDHRCRCRPGNGCWSVDAHHGRSKLHPQSRGQLHDLQVFGRVEGRRQP